MKNSHSKDSFYSHFCMSVPRKYSGAFYNNAFWNDETGQTRGQEGSEDH